MAGPSANLCGQTPTQLGAKPLDCGLDYGLYSGLDYGLDFRLDWTVNSALDLECSIAQ